MAEYQRIVQEYIHRCHDDGIDSEHFGAGDTYIQGAEHHIDEREEETEHAPVQKFAGGIVYGIRGDEHPHHRRSRPLAQTEQYACHEQQEQTPLHHDGTYFLVMSFTVASGYQYLRTGTESEGYGKDADIQQSAHRRSA